MCKFMQLIVHYIKTSFLKLEEDAVKSQTNDVHLQAILIMNYLKGLICIVFSNKLFIYLTLWHHNNKNKILMKIQIYIQTSGYWACSGCAHEHLFIGLIYLINNHYLGVKADT